MAHPAILGVSWTCSRTIRKGQLFNHQFDTNESNHIHGGNNILASKFGKTK